jgi:hypothetical protein
VPIVSPIETFHVGRVKDDAIERILPVWQVPAINTVLDVASDNFVVLEVDLLPKHPLAVGHIGNRGAFGYVKVENLGKDFCVVPNVSGKGDLCGTNSALHTTRQTVKGDLR